MIFSSEHLGKASLEEILNIMQRSWGRNVPGISLSFKNTGVSKVGWGDRVGNENPWRASENHVGPCGEIIFLQEKWDIIAKFQEIHNFVWLVLKIDCATGVRLEAGRVFYCLSLWDFWVICYCIRADYYRTFYAFLSYKWIPPSLDCSQKPRIMV